MNVVTSASDSVSGLKIVGEAFITSYTPEGAFAETPESTTVGVVIIPEDASDGDVEWTEPVEESKAEAPDSSPPQPDEHGLYPPHGWDMYGNYL